MRPSVQRLLVALQVAIILAMALAPAGVLAADPSPDPTAAPSQSAAPSPTVDPSLTADPSPSTDPSPSADPAPSGAATAEPTIAPTPDPTPSDPPATPADPTPEPDPTAAPSTSAPTITSDKDDYAPGELVTLSGAGWQPGESVHIYVNDDWGSSWSRTVDVTADVNGSVADQFNLPTWFVAVYTVIATGDAGSVVNYTFTDAQPQTVTVSGTPQAIPPGATASYGTVTVNFNGNNSSCTVTLTTTGTLPTGANAVFGQTTLTGTATASTTLSVTTTAATPVGTTTFQVQAAPGANCQNGAQTQVSSNLSLTIIKRVGSVAVGSQTGTPTFGTSSNATYTVTVTRGGPTGTAFTANLSVSAGLPSGASASFSPSAVTFAAADTTKTSTLTITTGTSAPAASTPFTVRAENAAGSGDAATSNGSLVIAKASSTTTVTCPAAVSYTGAALTPCSATATGAGGLSASVGVTHANNTNAGTASASATFAGDANHNGSSGSATFAINPAATTVTVTCPANVTFAGSALTPCSATATGAGGLNQGLSVTYGNNVHAGTASASASYAGDANHAAGTGNATFTIDKAASDVALSCPASVTYTGAALTPCAVLITRVGASSLGATISYSNNVDAGTATASASYAGDTDHTASSNSTTFTIDKAASTTTVSCPASVTYDGSALAPCTASVTGAGGLSQALTVTYADNTNAGTATASASFAGDANHAASSDSRTFTIEKAASSTTVTCDAGPFTFTGSAFEPCEVSVTGAGGLILTPDPDYADNVDAGTATASYTYAGDANHESSSDSATFEIAKASSTTTITCPASVTYDGTAQEPCSASVTGAGGLNQSLAVGYTDNTNAGTAHASASYAGDANHDPSNDAKTFTIDKAATTTTVTCDPGPFVYTGVAQEPCTAAVTGAGGLDQAVSVSYLDNVHAGTATASASYAGDANHVGSGDAETFTIEKAILTVDAVAAHKTYGDGDPVFTATLSGFVNGEDSDTALIDGVASCSRTNSSVDDAGLYPGVITCDPGTLNAPDYDFTTGAAADFTIDKAASSTTVTCDAGPFSYTGSAIEPCQVSVTGAGGLSLTPHPDYADNVNAGTATASYSYAGDANHTGSSDSTTFTIDKAASSTVVTCPTNVTYTGSALIPCSAMATGAGGLDETLTVDYADNINAGTASASASFAGDANHHGSNDSTTFTIDKAASTTTVTCPAGPYTYSGVVQEPCSATVTGAGGLSLTPDPDYGDNVNAGSATASFSYPGDANHLDSYGSDTFTIDKATLSVDALDSSKTFGDPDPAFHSILSGFVHFENPGSAGVGGSATCERTNNAEDADVYQDVISCDPGTLTAANYGFVSGATADFEIFKAPTDTTVTCTAGPFVFSGDPITPCSVTVIGAGLSLTPDADYIDNVNAGTATASYGYAGDTNHETSSDSTTFTIDKATSTTTVTCPAGPYSYTGAAQEPCSATVTGAGGLSLTPEPDYSDNVNAGAAVASYTYAGDANHNGSSDSDTFTIDKASSSTVITCPAHATYTGSVLTPCTAKATGAGGLDQALVVTHADNTNAGTASASASYAGDANHTASSDSKTFTIEKASSTTTVTCLPSVTFTGSPQTPCSATATGVGGLDETITVGYADHTNAGTATASASYAGDANHTASSDSTTFTIAKASSTTTITCPLSVTYTGSPLTPCTVSVTGVGGLNLAPAASYAANTNAGTATASYTFAGDANHTGSSDSKTFTIDKASSTTTVTCPTSVTYTGSALTPCSAAVTGAGGLSQSLGVTHGNNTNAGTATAAASYAGDANHTGSSDNTTFTIDKAASATSVTCPASVAYTATPLTPCTASVTGVGGLSQALAVAYSNNTGAGSASATASYSGDGNHLASTGGATFTITKATLLVSANPLSKTLGAANPALTYSVTGFLGPDTAASSVTGVPSLSTTATTGSPVGSYPITVTVGTLASSNYQFSFVGGTLTVRYRFDGFLQPINDTAHMQACGSTCPISVFKAGSTIPVKLELKRADGTIVSATALPTFTGPVKGGKTTDPIDESTYTDPPTSGSTFSLTGGQYQYNWSTKALQAGYYYRIGAALDDGTVQYVYIGLR